MPLLGISVLALLLLPLSLSCDSKSHPKLVQSHYSSVVRPHLDNTRESIATLLQNSNCFELKLRLRTCTPRHNDSNIVNILHKLTCRMKNFCISGLDKTGLISSVLHSIQCQCPDRSTKEPRTAKRWRRNEQRKSQREIKTLCRAEAVLSAMTECYELLNSHYGFRPT